MTTPTTLPHETGNGPSTRGEWRQLLATAPRCHDTIHGRELIQVCASDQGRGVFATVDYATWRAKQRQPASKARGQ